MGIPEQTRKIDIYRRLSLHLPCEGVQEDRAAATLREITAEAIHIHDCLELVYILSGTARVKISFNSFNMRQGDFLVINAGEVHRIEDGCRPAPGETGETRDCEPPAPDAAAYVKSAGLAAPLIALQLFLDPRLLPEGDLMIFHPDFYNREKPRLSQQAATMMRRFLALSAADADSPKARQLAREIAALCRQNFAIQRYSPDEGQAREEADLSQSGERAARFFQYLYQNYDQPLHLGDVADHLHVEKAYASRIIKSDTGAGFLDQLGIIRADRSELWLLATDGSIQSIAERVGFPSYDAYARTFRQYFGMSPGAYRKRYRPQTHPAAPMQVRPVAPSQGWAPTPDAGGLTLEEFDDRFVLTIYKG